MTARGAYVCSGAEALKTPSTRSKTLASASSTQTPGSTALTGKYPHLNKGRGSPPLAVRRDQRPDAPRVVQK
jgi:hypothetical protein